VGGGKNTRAVYGTPLASILHVSAVSNDKSASNKIIVCGGRTRNITCNDIDHIATRLTGIVS